MRTPRVRLYTSPTLPRHWILHMAHGPWVMFPDGPGGWRLRRRLRGSIGLVPTTPQTARVALRTAGFDPSDAI